MNGYDPEESTAFETTTFTFGTSVDAKPGDRLEAVPIGHDGKPLSYVRAEAINPNLARRYAGLYEVQQDLVIASTAIGASLQLSTEADSILAKSLLVNAVISYGRCFITAEGRGVVLNDKSPWIENIGEEVRWHAELMKLRHTLFAHAGNNPFKNAGTLLLLDSPDNPSRVQLLCLKWELHNVSKEDLLVIQGHLDRVLERVSKKLAEAGRKLENLAFESLVKK